MYIGANFVPSNSVEFVSMYTMWSMQLECTKNRPSRSTLVRRMVSLFRYKKRVQDSLKILWPSAVLTMC